MFLSLKKCLPNKLYSSELKEYDQTQTKKKIFPGKEKMRQQKISHDTFHHFASLFTSMRSRHHRKEL